MYNNYLFGTAAAVLLFSTLYTAAPLAADHWRSDPGYVYVETDDEGIFVYRGPSGGFYYYNGGFYHPHYRYYRTHGATFSLGFDWGPGFLFFYDDDYYHRRYGGDRWKHDGDNHHRWRDGDRDHRRGDGDRDKGKGRGGKDRR